MDFSGSNVLITGGSGFLGTHLTEALLESGAKVLIADIHPPALRHERLKYIECDISKASDLDKIPKDIDYIYHLAAIANQIDCEKDYELGFRVNVQGTFNMLSFAKDLGVKKFIFPSAASLYGKYPRYVPIDEEHPIDPADSVYLTTKRFGEILCETFYHKYALPVLYFRLFNTFGEGQRKGYLFTTLLSQAIHNGSVDLWNDKPVRDFVYVKDIIDAFLKGAETKFCGGPINLGSGKEITIGDLASKIVTSLKANGVDVDLKFQNKEVIGPMRLLCNPAKANRLLGWTPKTPIDEGINNTVKWFLKNKDRLEPIKSK